MNTFLILLAILAVMTGGTYFLSRPNSGDSGEEQMTQAVATAIVFCITAVAELLYALVKLVASL